MLRLALLGYDSSAAELLQAALDAEGFTVEAVCQSDDPSPLQPEFAHLRRVTDWEWLLHDASVDAVIVARGGLDQREDALRKLVQAGKPLLLTFPPCESIFAFELEMIRRDGGGPILIYEPQRLHGLFERFVALRGELGAIELVTITRQLPECSRPEVRDAFTADVALVRQFLGRLSQVSATGSTQESAAEPNLAVTLQSEAGGVGRWSVEPGQRRGAIVAVRGSAGKAQLRIGDSPAAWSMELPGGEVLRADESTDNQRLAREALVQLGQAVAGEAESATWDEICRDLEVADTIDHSLRRNRTIELYGDEVSERGTFKGMMAAGGCFLLLLALFVLFVVSVVEGLQAPFRNHFLWKLWPVYLLTPIVIFLMLQLLQLAIRPPSDGEKQ